jgi:hypothetical protein
MSLQAFSQVCESIELLPLFQSVVQVYKFTLPKRAQLPLFYGAKTMSSMAQLLCYTTIYLGKFHERVRRDNFHPSREENV